MKTTPPTPDLLANAAKAYATARAALSERATALEAEIADAMRRKLPGIRAAIAEAADAQAKLVALVDANQGLFESPRTMTLHGIKFGLKKGKGAVEWGCDDAELVARIEKRYKGNDVLLEQLVKTTKKPIVDALKELDAKDVAALGVTIESTGDYVFVKAADSEVDKLVKRFLKEGAIEEAKAA